MTGGVMSKFVLKNLKLIAMKHLKHLIAPVMYFMLLGLAVSGCKKDTPVDFTGDEKGTVLSKMDFTDQEIEQIAQLHNDYLLEMINYGVHDRNSLIDYLYDNFEEFRTISRDSLNLLLDQQAEFTMQDLLDLVNGNASEFNDAKKLTQYLTDANQYLVNFDINYLNNLEAQARSELTGIDWQVFYTYISVMKKSKEFWVDQNNVLYFNISSTNAQRIDNIIAADAKAAAYLVLGATIVGVVGILSGGTFGAALLDFAISALSPQNLAFTAAMASIDEAISKK